MEELHEKDIYHRKEDKGRFIFIIHTSVVKKKYLEKDKTIHQLAIETKNIMREERRKRNEELRDLKATKFFSEKEIKKLENELEQSRLKVASLEKEKQENIIEKESSRHIIYNMQQQLPDKTDIIASLKQEAELYKILLQTKSDELSQFKKINQIERENLKLMRKVREHQGCSQEPRPWSDKNDSVNGRNNPASSIQEPAPPDSIIITDMGRGRSSDLALSQKVIKRIKTVPYSI